MKVAVYSDLHGDVAALRAAFSLADELGCSTHLCCGDAVDEAHPADEIVRLLVERGVRCIRGNHERWLLAAAREGRSQHPLSRTSVAVLEGLPPHLDLDLAGVRIAIHHARPGSDMEGLYEDDLSSACVGGLLAETDSDVLLVGHTHEAVVAKHTGGEMVANPGALGRPPFVSSESVALISKSESSRILERDATRSGTFGVLRLPERLFQIYRLDGEVKGDP